jgi:cytidylate kinase
MAIITISRGSYSRGKEVAEKVAQKLGYDCISRDILLDASEQFNIPEIKFLRAIHDAPSILDRFTYGREKYIAYIQAALLKYLREDNMVYHGLAGHFFLDSVSHVLKVRIIAALADRVRLEMEREGTTAKEAMRNLQKDDEHRRKWSRSLYGIDTWDPSLYDLVIHIKQVTVDDAVDIICHAVNLKPFQTTPESRQAMNDLALAAEVRAALIDLNPTVEVLAQHGKVHVKAKSRSGEQELVRSLGAVARAVRGVQDVQIQVLPVTRYTE